jgi:MFS family permease
VSGTGRPGGAESKGSAFEHGDDARTDRPWSSLKHPDFRRLWAAQAISVLGTQITVIALPLVAITVLRAQPLEIALLAASGLVPFLIFGLPAGVLIERLPRRPLMIACDLTRAALLISVPVAALAGWVTMAQLFVVGFGVGTCQLLFDVADQSLLPRLLRSEELIEGNSRLFTTLSLGQIAGPAIAGALLAVVAVPLVICVDVLSYLASATLLSKIGLTEARAHGPAEERRRAWHSEVAEGLRHVFHHPLLRPTTVTATIYGLATGGIRAVMIIYMVLDLRMAASLAAISLAVGAIGFLIGSLMARRVTALLGIGIASIAGAVAGTVGPALLPLATPETAAPVLMVANFITGFGPSIYGINYLSLRQAVTPDRLRARMSATTRMVVWGSGPIGAVIAGLIGQAFGLRLAIAVLAAFGLTCLPVLWFSPFRQLRLLPVLSEPVLGG